ncbi:MAG: hypothetical protein SF028_07065 [Candidatus Sumerlaeia bacterium]|nr:hypothetical protein [Candidatus Sumerlaeia bacterium]
MRGRRFWREARRQVFGGAATPARDRRRAGADWRHALAMAPAFAVVIGLGLLHVDAVFRLRDYQIRAGVAQEAALRERDRARELGAELARAQDSARVAAVSAEGSGLVELSPERVEELALAPAARAAWAAAAERARAEWRALQEDENQRKGGLDAR